MHARRVPAPTLHYPTHTPTHPRPQQYAGGEFLLFFANCEPPSAVDFNVKIALYNVKGSGKLDFLPVGQDMLPFVYFVSCAENFMNPCGGGGLICVCKCNQGEM